MIEKDFDVSFIAGLALREKQIQQNYRPVIAVHKWFARRPGTLFRGLLLSEFAVGDLDLKENFYRANHLNVKVADPFMGGGTPLLEANRLGADVIGSDINPMAYWIVKQELESLDLTAYEEASRLLLEKLEKEIGRLYRTRCSLCGDSKAHVKYFLWVKTTVCEHCGGTIDLFPSYHLASNIRHPRHVVLCGVCGSLAEVEDSHALGACPHCASPLSLSGAAKRGRCVCPRCKRENFYPKPDQGAPRHRLIALEYFCPSCKERHMGRFFKVPDTDDQDRFAEAETTWSNVVPRFVPDDAIPSGDETHRLHRWGYKKYKEMFNARQLLGLELSARIITEIPEERVRGALSTNFSDLLRYQNMLCRYDSMALKSLDIFSVHGFPVGLIQCESNLLGIFDNGTKACVGSGGWRNITAKFKKAKAYCSAPFEFRHEGRGKKFVPIKGEWIGERPEIPGAGAPRKIELHCADAASLEIADASLDAVFTDPPYFGNVQYAELMDFCYVWLRQLLKDDVKIFNRETTRNLNELTANLDMGRGIETFAEGLSAVFRKMAKALKPGAPLVFTYHHNKIEAYAPVAAAILDASLVCCASLPCPAEMGASIHINGTESSIVDSVFVCRAGVISENPLSYGPKEATSLVLDDLKKLRLGGVKPSLGDTRCIAYGHLIRIAIGALQESWDKTIPTSQKIAKIISWTDKFGGWLEIKKHLDESDFCTGTIKKGKEVGEDGLLPF